MKTITITVHNRPQYFKKLLQGLIKNNLDGWDIVVGLEPAPKRPEQLALIEKYIPQASVIFNKEKLGVTHNPYNVLSYVFEKLNSKINIYLEEDIIISPDVCQLADWYYNLGDDSMCFTLLNLGRREVDEINSNEPHSCVFYGNKKMTMTGGGSGFSSLGFFLKKEQWETYFKPNWYNHVSGWDCSVFPISQRPENRILVPYKTRSDHIGEYGGVHVKSPKTNKKCKLGSLNVSQELVSPESYWIYDHTHLS
jgi:hypothetical protein